MRSVFAVLTLLLALTTLCWPNKPRKPHSPERLPIQTAIACLELASRQLKRRPASLVKQSAMTTGFTSDGSCARGIRSAYGTEGLRDEAFQ